MYVLREAGITLVSVSLITCWTAEHGIDLCQCNDDARRPVHECQHVTNMLLTSSVLAFSTKLSLVHRS
jgi:hypothetical protein